MMPTQAQIHNWHHKILCCRHTYAPARIEPLTGAAAILLRHCASNPDALADLAQATLAGEVIYTDTSSPGGPVGHSTGVTAALLPLCNETQKDLWYHALVAALASKQVSGVADLDACVYEIAQAAFEAHEADFAIRWVSHAYPLFAAEIKSKAWPARDTMKAFLRCPGKSPEHIEQALSIFQVVCKNPALMWKEVWDSTTAISSSCMRLPCQQATREMLHPDLFALADIPSLLGRSLEACWLPGVLHAIEHPSGAKRLQDNLDWLLDPALDIGMVSTLMRVANRNVPHHGSFNTALFNQALALVDGLASKGPAWLADPMRTLDFTPCAVAFPLPDNVARISKMQLSWSTLQSAQPAAKPATRF